MKHHIPSDDPDHDFEVEITSLDESETPVHASNALLQGARLAPRVRLWLTILSVVGGLLLLFVVFFPVLPSLLPKKTSAPPTFHAPPASIQNVTVQNGMAYLTSSDGILRALSLRNGSLVWKRNVGGSAPFFINNTVYIDHYSDQGSTVQALSAINGTVLWTFKTSLDISPLIIDNGVAYTLFPFSSPGPIVTALDSRSGAEIWHYTIHLPPSTSLYIQEIQDKIYVNVYETNQNQLKNTDFWVLRVSDGSLLWYVKAVNMQAMQNNLVSITTNDDVLHMLHADNGHEVWHYKSSGGINFYPYTGDGLMYMQTAAGWLQAIRIDNGAVLWTYKDPWGVSEVFPDTNGVLYVETGDGFIVALRTSDGKRLWHVRPIAPPYTFGSIQVKNGIVYTFITIGEAQYQSVEALRASNGSILWKRQVGTSSSNMPPQVFNDLLLTDSGSTITVLSARNSAALWHQDYVQTLSQNGSGFLALANALVILRSSNNDIIAHQAETGAVLWRYPR